MMVNNLKNSSYKRFSATIMVLVGILFMVNFASAITWDNIAYYKLDESSGVVIDSEGLYDLTNTGATAGVTGVINTAYDFEAGDTTDSIDGSFADVDNYNSGFSINMWYKPESVSPGTLHALLYIGTEEEIFVRVDAASGLDVGLDGTLQQNVVTLVAETQYMITVTHNSTHDRIYVNETLIGQYNSATWAGNSPNLWIGNRNAGTTPADGIIDEVGIWNRTLTSTEVTQLYNGGSGITYGGFEGDPTITLDSPVNDTSLSSTSVNFTASFNITSPYTYNYTWDNATFYLWYSNGTLFDSNYTTLSGNNTISTRTLSDLTINEYIWNVKGWYSNDTTSNYTWASSNYTFEWRPFEIDSQDYYTHVYETDNQRFNLSITTLPDILSVSSKLNYNGTEYTGITSCTAGDCDIYSIIDIPLVSSGETINYSYYWTITVYDGTSSFSFDTTSTTLQQNVTRIHLEKCAGVYTTETANFTAYREDNLTLINPFKFQGTFDSWLGSGNVKRITSFNEASTASLNLCLTPVTRTQFTNAIIEYSFNNENITYVPRNYHFQNASLTNISNEIKLYLLEAEDSTSFIIKVQDQKLSGVEDALVYIQKYFPEDGEYRTVQIAKTDSNGETIGFYEVETVDYKHIIIKNGEVLLETTSQKVVGKSVPYTLTFTVGDALGFPWSSFEKDPNVYSSLTYNKTSMIVTFTYIDTLGATTAGRLLVLELSNSNSTKRTICDLSSTQASATLTCNMTGHNGNFIAYGYIETEVTDILDFLISTAIEIFGKEGLLIGIFIVMVAGLAFIWNPTAGIVAMNAAVILTSMIGFMVVSPVFIFSMIAISFIAIILLKT